MQAKFDENLLEISDGRLYEPEDAVRVGCHECEGCSDCCQGMGDTILLDPFDIDRLSKGLGLSFEQLLQGPVELHLEEGLILPNLKMVSWTQKLTEYSRLRAQKGQKGRAKLMTPRTADEACFFLNEEGRCSIHPLRPGFCRLFPMGRSYREGKLFYFLLREECPVKDKTEMKLEDWLAMPEGQEKEYEDFLLLWHRVSAAMREEVTRDPQALEENRRMSMTFLQYFYLKPYGDTFFEEFCQRALALGIR